MFSTDDEMWMRQALALAARGMLTTTPNPRVGCVLVKDGQVVGEGWHARAGDAHAEVNAIRAAGTHRAVGATAYVTLEPCSHFGKTPPCVHALRDAGVVRVIAAMQDPNPQVAGRGLQALRDAGIDVRCGLLADEAEDLNPGFIKRMRTGLPWVRAKTAASLDGRTALPDGTSQWITDSAARDDGHAWRARACAVLTGIGTVRKDNPQMTVRALATPRQPLRVIVDTRFEIDTEAAVLAGGNALLAVGVDVSLPALREKADGLRARGVELVVLPLEAATRKLDLRALLVLLGERGCNELHVEGGAQLTGAMMRLDLIDEWLVYLAPVLLGEGRPIAANIGPWATVDDAPRWHWREHAAVGDALRLRLVKTKPNG
jgi:diaminohydroxyphosphoribosylaminopyrimidine deaminase / 5-amino-6-(5-phosphoribosylamino)uracil reductase